MTNPPADTPVRMDYQAEALDLALDNLLVCVRNDEGMGDDMTAMDVRLALSKVRSLFVALRADTPVTEPRKLLTLKESNDPANDVTTKEPCAGCGSTKWAWRAGTFIPFPNTCSDCPPVPPPSDLGKMLDELEAKLTDLISANPRAIAATKADARAARSSIERWAAERINERDFQELRATTHLTTVNRLSAELSTLRELQLTPEEAAQIVGTLTTSAYFPSENPLLTKLRLLQPKEGE